MEDLSIMGLFVEVARKKSFRRAADALGMPSSTLSRRIVALEQSLGLRLLHRTTRQVELTEAGEIYFERSARIIDEARLAHQHLAELSAQPSGPLRVSLPVDFGIIFVARHMAAFCQRYPAISIEFDLSPRRVDLVSEPFDVAIRMGELPDSGLIARKLAEIPRALYASRRYLAQQGEPKTPIDLTQHNCLLFPREQNWDLYQGNDIIKVPVTSQLRLNNVGMMQKLAAEGAGIALLSQEAALPNVKSGHLVRVLPSWSGKPIAVHAISETRLLPAKTQRFIEYLAECLDPLRNYL
ncbi:MAG: LysR family transcriptional regulator [Pseudomonas aeruginosa]